MAAAWGVVEGSRGRCEFPITPGRIEMDYAAKLQIRFTYASNGRGVYAIDMDTGVDSPPSPIPTRSILFLVDRNNLADLAINDFTAFAAFEDNTLTRIEPDALRKKGRVPTNASVFLTSFQTFMSAQWWMASPPPGSANTPLTSSISS